MNYQTYQPHPDLSALVKCYWTLEVPAEFSTERQRIIPDGCIEMAFILGDDIKRYTNEEDFIIQPRAMILGQTIEPFYIEPTGYVNTFAVRFYPIGFTNFVTIAIRLLANKETALQEVFEMKAAGELEQKIILAATTRQRIEIIEEFLRDQLNDKIIIDKIVQLTVDTLLSTNGTSSISQILKATPSKRRQLERKFIKQIGISPKQLGKVIRLQTALKMLLKKPTEKLTDIAYQSEYYDQSHFIKDFKEFTGTNPHDFFTDQQMQLSTIFYAKD